MLMKKQRGFTLIELLVYLGLFSLLIIVITDILVTTLDIQLSSSAYNSVTADGRYIYSRFIYDINRAQSVALPQNLGDISNNLQFTADGNSYSYTLNNGNLVLTDSDGSHQLNSYDSSISNLNFQRIGNSEGKHTFRINFTITGKTVLRGNTEVKNFQTTAGIR
ncbi:hypothetical protein A2153_01965 [Candidatus Gottesmanbacteria bacterium RBG_16_38_7b]|uniref:Prepilin-type N-terminal cleavage/methylation domain-containing protein n=2 Tax=Candidatus Gottesmaniibacteriota TaxID=1752720 RepID=A0A1F5YIB3_9BACT|nr:MAG: hypothetical protein A2153_01965 [Candidatus Gottesmanbacteria bacterium RBG_16_38_7b]